MFRCEQHSQPTTESTQLRLTPDVYSTVDHPVRINPHPSDMGTDEWPDLVPGPYDGQHAFSTSSYVGPAKTNLFSTLPYSGSSGSKGQVWDGSKTLGFTSSSQLSDVSGLQGGSLNSSVFSGHSQAPVDIRKQVSRDSVAVKITSSLTHITHELVGWIRDGDQLYSVLKLI